MTRHAADAPADAVEDYLDRLLVTLSGSPRQVRYTLAEVEAHLHDAVAEGMAAGLTEPEAQAQAVRVSGSGSYAARQLETAGARIEMTGSGHAELTVNEQLDVNLSGSGSVEYFGHPVVNEHITGSGSFVSKS